MQPDLAVVAMPDYKGKNANGTYIDQSNNGDAFSVLE